jgi:muramoyltetrapeptide carboxypeptidase
MKYPEPLKEGSKIAVTAFSAGVPAPCHQRLDIVIANLKCRGFTVVEGQCLRENNHHVSASKEQRAKELMDFLCDDSVDAIMPPWGGELAMDILPLLDYEQLNTVKPKWLMGFSDVSTILTAITTKVGWSTAHTANLMQLHPSETELLTASVYGCLGQEVGSCLIQRSSTQYQTQGFSLADNPNATLNLTEPTRWKVLGEADDAQFSGRLIGGCLDTISHIIGTEYFDIDAFQHTFKSDGVILYFENAEMSPTVFVRALLSMKYKGVFNLLNGLLIGRSAVTTHCAKDMSPFKALSDALGDLNIPVVYDADIGHQPPNMTLLNGSYAEVTVKNGAAKVVQTLK